VGDRSLPDGPFGSGVLVAGVVVRGVVVVDGDGLGAQATPGIPQ
jgi:hypothetical protein